MRTIRRDADEVGPEGPERDLLQLIELGNARLEGADRIKRSGKLNCLDFEDLYVIRVLDLGITESIIPEPRFPDFRSGAFKIINVRLKTGFVAGIVVKRALCQRTVRKQLFRHTDFDLRTGVTLAGDADPAGDVYSGIVNK